EISFDRFHKNAPELYRLTTTLTNQDGSRQTLGTTGQVQGPAFKEAIPEISDYLRMWGIDAINMSANNKSLSVNTRYVDENFFDMFSFPLSNGNVKIVLSDPFSIVVSETTALKFFGTTDVIGKTLKIEEGRGIENLVITGVAKNAPANSSIQFDVLVPFKYLQLMFTDGNWLNQYLTTFILLRPGSDPKIIQQKFAAIFKTQAREQLHETKTQPGRYQFALQPFTDLHLHPLGLNPYLTADEERGLSGGSTIIYSYILTGIVGFILLMACVNFINLSISDSLKRSKEIGVRKIAGSNRRQIVFQFLVEASLLCIISYVLAISLSKIFLPVFNQLAYKKISLPGLTDLSLFFYGIILILICVVIAGIYPAITLSLFNPAEVLYNKQKVRGKNLFGKSLIVLQFTLAVALIISTIVYYRQMKFISNQDLGYNAADIMKIHLPPQRIDSKVTATLRNELAKFPSIRYMTTYAGGNWDNRFLVNGKEFIAKSGSVDEFYLPALEIPLKAGRNFSTAYETDAANSIIVNETFVRSLGWKNAIGQQLVDLEDNNKVKAIVGVVKDYHYGSLKQKIQPQVLSMIYAGNNGDALIKIQKGKTVQALNAIETTYSKLFPQHYFYYQFLDDENARAYASDRNWQQIVSYSALVAILICCTGLFGLSSFTAHTRYKEIGIRKVLGASVASITQLLAQDFVKLIIVAIVIASPVAWLAMNKWLQNYAYSIQINGWIFLTAAIVSILIGIITVSFQAIRAAIANPVKSLRTE
ncbi:MAG TPA: FtsX-like permease family protein, partial [Chitinophagaceae bacterium]|nr:FtsX-like permease family protein [Chitinophagaceae bacterium]